TLPTRVRVDGAQRVVPWLRALQEQQSESRRYDFVALADLRAWSDLPGGVNLFDSMVVFENYPIDDTAVSGDGVRVREVRGVDTTSFPLTLSADLAEGLHLELAFDPRLFDTATVRRLADHLAVLLAGLVADPDRPVAAVPMMSGGERQRVLGAGCGAAAEVPAATFTDVF
ncbi:hypothetical protein HC031_32300, partial [Planosporangium thailandense]